MKLFTVILSFGLIVASPCLFGGASAKKKMARRGSTLQTDVKFDDSVLHGKYQSPGEALMKVENEKGLNDLLGVRKHFKDRLMTASEQE